MRALWKTAGLLTLAAMSAAVHATPVTAPVPEPGMLELALIGGVAALGARWLKNRRK